MKKVNGELCINLIIKFPNLLQLHIYGKQYYYLHNKLHIKFEVHFNSMEYGPTYFSVSANAFTFVPESSSAPMVVVA